MSNNILVLIPARGGSKSIPRKNIKNLCGKPLIAWSIEAALKNNLVSRVVVSTDDKEIINIAKKYGAEIPFVRPSHLALDTSTTLEVVKHAVNWFKENENIKYDIVVLLEPTSPARMHFHIDEAIKVFLNEEYDSVVSISRVPSHYNPYWQFTLGKKNKLNCFVEGNIKDIITRRQDLPDTYTRNGAIYVLKSKNFLNNKPSLYGDNVFGFLMDDKYSVDIDSLEDWKEAEIKIKKIYYEEHK